MQIYHVIEHSLIDDTEKTITICSTRSKALEKIQDNLISTSLAWRYNEYFIESWRPDGEFQKYEVLSGDQLKELFIAAGGNIIS